DRAPSPRRAHLLAPLDPPEVWGAGITYRRSMQYYEAHTDEGGRTKGIYDHVYESERPELFFKATASRTVGPNGAIGIRRDSALTCRILRDGRLRYEGRVNTKEMKRPCAELVEWLGRSNPVPAGTVLSTGTGILVPDEHALSAGDVVEIELERVGTLRNVVRRLP